MVEAYLREYDNCLPEMCLDCNVDPCNEPCDAYKKKYENNSSDKGKSLDKLTRDELPNNPHIG